MVNGTGVAYFELGKLTTTEVEIGNFSAQDIARTVDGGGLPVLVYHNRKTMANDGAVANTSYYCHLVTVDRLGEDSALFFAIVDGQSKFIFITGNSAVFMGG